ncbi:MAG: hypothetical protein HQK54_13995 [Oligoflexales bacterium]|nr:hypothetical protein [Oligoflexales bacterium]
MKINSLDPIGKKTHIGIFCILLAVALAASCNLNSLFKKSNKSHDAEPNVGQTGCNPSETNENDGLDGNPAAEPCKPSEGGSATGGDTTPTETVSTETTPAPPDTLPFPVGNDIFIDKVFLAQTHILRPDDPLFRLVARRTALLKVNVRGNKDGIPAPEVTAILRLSGREQPLKLGGPTTLPTNFPELEQSFKDSFTAMIPKEWVEPGLSLSIKINGIEKKYDFLNIGAPSRLKLKMFTINIFGSQNTSMPAGWEGEFEAKLPVSSAEIIKTPPWQFSEIVVIPRYDVKLSAYRIKSQSDYKTQSGQNFDGEQGTALTWMNAIQAASGDNRLSVYFGEIGGVPVGGGLADSFTAMGRIGHTGIFFHEFGHTLSLPHWCEDKTYPYRGTMFNIPPSGFSGNKCVIQESDVHVGAAWGFDQRDNGAVPGYGFPYMIPPVVQNNPVSTEDCVVPGHWKKDPMCGGGSNDQEQGFAFRMYSDFSVHRMQLYLEKELVVYNEDTKTYTKWNDTSKSYVEVANNGVDYPVTRNADVYTILINSSAVTQNANFIYPPIGPYKSNLISRFDPRDASDRQRAASTGYCSGGCDFSLRVRQGGVESIYIIKGKWNTAAEPARESSLNTAAINLPAASGKIERMELLLTPGVTNAGLPASDTILYKYGI